LGVLEGGPRVVVVKEDCRVVDCRWYVSMCS
jgi:uncharacterized protein YodC (DUF2158 family)